MSKTNDRTLESFSSEVLAQFIRNEVPMLNHSRCRKVLESLIHIEAIVEMNKISSKIEDLMKESEGLIGDMSKAKKYLEIGYEITRQWEERDRWMEIAFPKAAAQVN